MNSQPGPLHHSAVRILLLTLAPLFTFSGPVRAQSPEAELFRQLENRMIRASDARDFTRILVIGDSMLNLSPANKKVLGFCYETALRGLDDTARALKYLEKSVALYPADYYFLVSYSWLLMSRGEAEKACQYCEKAYQHGRTEIPAIVNYAHCLQIAGRYGEAEEKYQEALDLGDGSDAVWNELEKDLLLLQPVYPDARFDRLRLLLSFLNRMNRRLYLQANTRLREFETLNSNPENKIEQVLEAIEKGLAAESEASRQRIKRISKYLTTLGYTHYVNGRVKPALEYYHQAAGINLNIPDYKETGRIYSNIGSIYRTIRSLDSAYYYEEGAAYYYRLAGDAENEANSYYGMAVVLNVNTETARALPLIQQKVWPLALASHNGAALLDASIFLGQYYADHDQPDSALYYLGKAQDFAILYSLDPEKLVLLYNQLAIDAVRKKNYPAARKHLSAIYSAIPREQRESFRGLQVLTQTGVLFYMWERYDSARHYLDEAVRLVTVIRHTLDYKEKLKFLADQADLFSYLAACAYRQGDAEAVYNAIELSRSLVLLEKMGGELSLNNSLKKMQEQMRPDEVRLLTFFADAPELENSKILLAIDKTRTSMATISDSTLLFLATSRPEAMANDTVILLFRRLWKNDTDPQLHGLRKAASRLLAQYLQKELEMATTLSRGLILLDSTRRKEHGFIARYTGQVFYKVLLEPFRELLQGKKKLVIIPDGQLAFLPFEALVDENGHYLTEKFDISYLPSVKVAEQMQQRSRPNQAARILLAGNPVYQHLTEEDFSAGVRPLYQEAGLTAWNPLPGTRSEIKAIQRFYPDALVLDSLSCTEEKIKGLLKKGSTRYRLIHFATHRHIMDSLPGLSAIILSQLSGLKGEDGYLTAEEIKSLSIPAELVVLSACQTGKGQLLESEGVQGLSSSFLAAGANSLIVSLWSVSDKSTGIFMEELYRKVSREGLSFRDAIPLVKRDFLAGRFGKEYQQPFYWAPFIYIGN